MPASETENESELRKSVAEILEVAPEELAEDTELESFDAYDSTAQLSLMVCLSDISGYPFDLAALKGLRTYGDIIRLMRRSSADGQGS